MTLDWSSDGIDWRDETMDTRMAEDWLAAVQLPDFASTDVYARVLELMQSDLNPERAWRLVKTLVRLAPTSRELFVIGADALSAIVHAHEDLVGEELARLAASDPKFREAFRGQIDSYLHKFKQKWNLQL